MAAPFIVLGALVARFHDTVPMYDEWAMVPFFQHRDAGTLGLGEFWQQQADHRIVLPRLIIFGLGVMTDWNVRYEVTVSLAIAAATFPLLLHLINRYFADREASTRAGVVASLIVFSPLAWENWLWGFQIAFFLDVFGLVLAVAALTGLPRLRPRTRFALAVAGAGLASLSLSPGLLVWVVCLPAFVVVREWRRWAIPWTVLGIAAVSIYLVGYDDVRDASGFAFLDSPSGFVRYWVTYLSRPITFGTSAVVVTSLLLGVITVGVARHVWRGRRAAIEHNLPWLVLMLYVVVAAAGTAVGRAGLGAAQASSSRYTTVSNLFLLSVVMMLLGVPRSSTQRRARGAARVAVGLLTALVAVNYVDGVRQMERHYSEHVVVADACARAATGPDDPCLPSMHPSPAEVWPLLEFLREENLSGL